MVLQVLSYFPTEHPNSSLMVSSDYFNILPYNDMMPYANLFVCSIIRSALTSRRIVLNINIDWQNHIVSYIMNFFQNDSEGK